jgi:hypothetical protein
MGEWCLSLISHRRCKTRMMMDMEQDTKAVLTPPVKDQETQVRKDTQELHQADFGRLERGVRAMIGVPLAISFIYIRHEYFLASIFLLLIGLYLVGTAVFHYCPVRHLIFWDRWKRPPH